MRRTLKKWGFSYSKEQHQLLAEYIDSNSSGNISKKEFKHAFRIVETDNSISDAIMQQLCSVLFENKLGLQRAFRMMDSDSSGTLDLQEFITGLQALNTALGMPLTEGQIKSLFNAIDHEKRGYIDYMAFLREFELVDEDKGPQKFVTHDHKHKLGEIKIPDNRIQPKKEEKKSKKHNFELTRFNKPTYCQYCKGKEEISLRYSRFYLGSSWETRM